MFTGIVTAIGTVSERERLAESLQFVIAADFAGVQEGESIAVNGACLTVVRHGEGWFSVQAVRTTRDRTTFEELQAGDSVNLERALQVGDRLGGHWVQGHVDGVGTVENVQRLPDAVLVDLRVPGPVAACTIERGSITVDGVSLTVNATREGCMVQVSLIPFTVDHTTLGRLRAGDRVHIEGDVLGKYVQQLMTPGTRGGEG